MEDWSCRRRKSVVGHDFHKTGGHAGSEKFVVGHDFRKTGGHAERPENVVWHNTKQKRPATIFFKTNIVFS